MVYYKRTEIANSLTCSHNREVRPDFNRFNLCEEDTYDETAMHFSDRCCAVARHQHRSLLPARP